MRLVDDDRIGARQDLPKAFLLEYEIGEQQVMVDHDHVGRGGVAARVHHMTALEIRTTRAEAVFHGGGDARHQRIGLVAESEFGDFAAAGRGQPLPDPHQALDLHAIARIVERPLGAIDASVVAAPLEQRAPHRYAQRLRHARQVTMKQLVLQVLGAG